MFRAALKIAIVIFICMLVFGGAEVIGVLQHVWLFIDHVIHGRTPSIKLPFISSAGG